MPARSAVVFFSVHSSRSSPTPSKNITELAVLKSLLSTDTPTATPSSKATSIFPLTRLFIPAFMYLSDFAMVSATLTGIGVTVTVTSLFAIAINSLS